MSSASFASSALSAKPIVLPPLACPVPLALPEAAAEEALGLLPVFAQDLRAHFLEFPPQRPGAAGDRFLAVLDRRDWAQTQKMMKAAFSGGSPSGLHALGLSNSSFRGLVRKAMARCISGGASENKEQAAFFALAPRSQKAGVQSFDFKSFWLFSQALRAMGLGPVIPATSDIPVGRVLFEAVGGFLGREAALSGSVLDLFRDRDSLEKDKLLRSVMIQQAQATHPEDPRWRGAWMALPWIAGVAQEGRFLPLDWSDEFSCFSDNAPMQWALERAGQANAAQEADALRAAIEPARKNQETPLRADIGKALLSEGERGILAPAAESRRAMRL